jgi:hypothetical protein
MKNYRTGDYKWDEVIDLQVRILEMKANIKRVICLMNEGQFGLAEKELGTIIEILNEEGYNE